MLSDHLLISSYVAYGKNMSIKLVAYPNICGTVQVFTVLGKPITVMPLSKFYDYCLEKNYSIDTPMEYDESDDIAYTRLLLRLRR